MTLNRNIRRAEGVLRSVPDPGQIVYDPRFGFCDPRSPDMPLTCPCCCFFDFSHIFGIPDFQIAEGWRDKHLDHIGFTLLQ